jgi:hypothetical protein
MMKYITVTDQCGHVQTVPLWKLPFLVQKEQDEAKAAKAAVDAEMKAKAEAEAAHQANLAAQAKAEAEALANPVSLDDASFFGVS